MGNSVKVWFQPQFVLVIPLASVAVFLRQLLLQKASSFPGYTWKYFGNMMHSIFQLFSDSDVCPVCGKILGVDLYFETSTVDRLEVCAG